MIEARGFNGKLNLDDNAYKLPNGDYVDALNITRDAQGTGQDEVISNVVGNQLFPGQNVLLGINKVIGSYADKVRNRIYMFIWNSNGAHNIKYIDFNTNTASYLMVNFINTGSVNVLKFNPSFRINHIDIIYRDDEGDLLFWTDGLNPPRKINVKTATTGAYGTILESYIDVAKEPPTRPPLAFYENDAAVTINNLNNKQFKFKARYVYDDLEKSVTSAQGELSIPLNYTAQSTVADPTKNAYIQLFFQSGAKNVTKIEIMGCESLGTTWSDFFLITVLDKAALAIPNNTLVNFDFYNDQVYNTIPLDESIQPFDNVPQIAYTQSLPNGNVLDYGAITESYDLIEPSHYVFVTSLALNTNSQDSRLAYNWNSRYAYGVVYFDSKGRTNGVITSVATSPISSNSAFQTVNYRESAAGQFSEIPQQGFNIYNRPPSWATYYHVVRTRNLSKSNFLYWVSDKTFQDTASNQAGYKYAYISIATLNNYIIENPELKTLAYEFTPGDRIRFVKLYDANFGTAQIYSDKDFEILASLTDPIINGTVVPGQTLKILLPVTSGFFDFGSNYSHYLVELYTPAPNFSTELNLFYEFGQSFSINLAGTANAYHTGSNTNQNYALQIPASFNFSKGDAYFRARKMPIGGSIKFQCIAGYYNPPGTSYLYTGGTVLSNFNTNPFYTGQDWVAISGGSVSANSFPILYNSLTPPTILIDGSITFVSNINTGQFNIQLLVATTSGNNFTGAGFLLPNQSIVASQQYTFRFSRIVQLPVISGGAAGLVWAIGAPGGGQSSNLTIIDWNVRVSNPGTTSILQNIIDPNFSDNYDSSASPNGRAWKFDPNAAQAFNPTLTRFGGEFFANTTVNNTNRFYEENAADYDRSRGSIKKMFIEGRNQYIFQEFDVGVVTILTQIVKDTAGNPLSAQSDTLLNKIVYPYIGGYGIGNVPESFAYGKHAKFFVDNNKGVVCRLSTDGITPISILHKTNAFFVAKTALFKDTLNTFANTPATGTATIYGAYDAYTNKYIIALSQIVRSSVELQPAYTLSFLDSRDNKQGFESFLSFAPENMTALNNLFVTFKDGKAWTHNANGYCTFYGVLYNCYVEAVFNDRPLDKKTFLAIMQTSNSPWYCPSIKSQLNSYGSTPQLSSISEPRFVLLEGQYNSSILRDANSPGGIINGDTMHGNYLIIKFQRDQASAFYYINTVSLNYINSPLNTR